MKLSPHYVALLNTITAGQLSDYARALSDEYDHTPRSRFLRRAHLERQLILVTFAEECYAIGWHKGLKSTVHDP